MQFSNFSRIEDQLTITFKNEVPLEKVAQIKFFKDNASGLFSKKEFRWSFNNAYWSSWEILTQNAFSSLNMHGNFYLFLQIRYTLTALGSGSITSFALTYTESSAISPTNPAHFHDDIETADASSVLIHDIIQHHTFATITDASTLNGYSGSYYLDRAHHTGRQAISSITGLQAILNSIIEASSGIDVNKAYVDASLVARDLSINNLYDIKVDIQKTAGDITGYVINNGDHIDIGPYNSATGDYSGIYIEPSTLYLYVNHFPALLPRQFVMTEENIKTTIPIVYDGLNVNNLSQQSLVTKQYDDQRWINIDRYGFMNQTDTSIWYNLATNVFTLSTSTGLGSWKYMRAGIEYTIDHDVSVQLFTTAPDNPERYFIYIDSSDGSLISSTTSWTLRDTKIPVSLILYDVSASPTYLLGEERHSCLIDRREHWYNHSTRGTQLVSATTIIQGPVVGAGQDSSTTVRILSVTIADEDIIETLPSLSGPLSPVPPFTPTRPDGSTLTYIVANRVSAPYWTWDFKAVPFNYEDGSYIKYDNGGTFTTGQDGKFYNYYLLYTNFDSSARFLFIPGRAEFDSLEEAREENPLTFQWTDIPIAESIIAYQFTWETSGGLTNKGKVSLAATPRRIMSTATSTIPPGTGIYHNLTAGMQGGNYDTAEFYHLDQTQYNNVVNASFGGDYVKKTGDTMSGPLTINASLYVNGNVGIGKIPDVGAVLDVSGTLATYKGVQGAGSWTNLYGSLDWTTAFFQAETYNYYGMIYSAVGNHQYAMWQEFLKSRSADGNTPVAVQLNDELARFNFRGDDGQYMMCGAAMRVIVDDNVSTNYVAAKIEFNTQLDSVQSWSVDYYPQYPSLVIKHTGKVGVGTRNPSTYLDVSGNFHTSGAAKIDGSLNVINSTYFGASSSHTHNFIGDLDVSGNLTAVTKSFLINHPTKPGKKLQYGNLEGPEHAVYIRGKFDTNYIDLPDYWKELVDQNSITAQLTSSTKWNIPYVKQITDNRVYIGKYGIGKLEGYYTIYAERKDIAKLITEKQN